MFIEGLSLFPDGQTTFQFLLSTTIQKVPNPLNGIILHIILVKLQLLVLLPSMEDSRFDLIVAELLCYVIVLKMCIKRLQAIIVPRVEPSLHLVMPQFQGND